MVEPDKMIGCRGPNLISVDLEDWYHSAFLRDYAHPATAEPTIPGTTGRILELFDRHGVKATFFVLGRVAERHGDVIENIAQRGHEIASHGYSHLPLWSLTAREFRAELRHTNALLEGIAGGPILGFRAPYASLSERTSWALDVLEEEGFVYDSSVFPMKTPLYGVCGAPRAPYGITSKNLKQHDPEAVLTEIPFSVCELGPLNVPCTGGIYGRFMPLSLLAWLLKRVEAKRPINFYFHPWETKGGVPSVAAPLLNKWISCWGAERYLKGVGALLERFEFTSFKDYLSRKGESS